MANANEKIEITDITKPERRKSLNEQQLEELYNDGFTSDKLINLVSLTTQEIRTLAKKIGKNEMRELVEIFYAQQHDRIKEGNRLSAAKKLAKKFPDSGETYNYVMVEYFYKQHVQLEKAINVALSEAILKYPISRWLLSIYGIGPTITAGLIAYIDIGKCQTFGQLQRFAGLDPTCPPKKKGEKLHYCQNLKTLCWKIGKVFEKFKNNDKCYYGKIINLRRAYEEEKNERGDYAEQAKKLLQEKNWRAIESNVYKIYQEGKLPPSHLSQRCRRYAVKMFLSHLFEVWYIMDHGCLPPAPYPIAHMGHAHYIEPPNKEIVGLDMFKYPSQQHNVLGLCEDDDVIDLSDPDL